MKSHLPLRVHLKPIPSNKFNIALKIIILHLCVIRKKDREGILKGHSEIRTKIVHSYSCPTYFRANYLFKLFK